MKMILKKRSMELNVNNVNKCRALEYFVVGEYRR